MAEREKWPDNCSSAQSSKQVVLGRADDRGGGRFGRRPGEAAHKDDRGRLGGVPLAQRGGGGDLVGKTGLGDLELAAEQVGLAAPVDDRWQSCGAKRDADGAAPPRPAEAVADDDGDALAGAGGELLLKG